MHNLFYKSLLHHFGYPPTKNQLEVIGELTDFVFLKVKKHLFVLKGYAGTGKTSLIGALVKTLPEFHFDSVLLAPTGRAAKVLANYAQKPAFTIHKMIYQLRSGGDGFTRFIIKENKFQNTLFLVDEASMINDGGGLTGSSWGESKSLLDDLLQYVYSGINCKLILIGDTAQLPPVGMDMSPALDEDFLFQSYHLNIEMNELSEVVRQQKDAEVLVNATYLRKKIAAKDVQLPLFNSVNSNDVKRISGEELEDVLSDAYGKFGDENVMIITRSNKRANLFNMQVRVRIRWLEDELAAGDFMMVVKNNYFWLTDDSKAGFIANGDIVEILKIKGIEELYGFRFANVTVRMIDYLDEPDME
ncbi:MAG: AAA family ATPase, partial [Vicingus serpentipes]|nr:AAA family ATPase [Vicingus serpentipes]